MTLTTSVCVCVDGCMERTQSVIKFKSNYKDILQCQRAVRQKSPLHVTTGTSQTE